MSRKLKRRVSLAMSCEPIYGWVDHDGVKILPTCAFADLKEWYWHLDKVKPKFMGLLRLRFQGNYSEDYLVSITVESLIGYFNKTYTRLENEPKRPNSA